MKQSNGKLKHYLLVEKPLSRTNFLKKRMAEARISLLQGDTIDSLEFSTTEPTDKGRRRFIRAMNKNARRYLKAI